MTRWTSLEFDRINIHEPNELQTVVRILELHVRGTQGSRSRCRCDGRQRRGPNHGQGPQAEDHPRRRATALEAEVPKSALSEASQRQEVRWGSYLTSFKPSFIHLFAQSDCIAHCADNLDDHPLRLFPTLRALLFPGRRFPCLLSFPFSTTIRPPIRISATHYRSRPTTWCKTVRCRSSLHAVRTHVLTTASLLLFRRPSVVKENS